MSDENGTEVDYLESESVTPPPLPVKRELLETLAELFGVATQNISPDGSTVKVTDEALRAVLVSFGADDTDDESLEASIAAHHDAEWLRVVPAALTLREGSSKLLKVHVAAAEAKGVTAWLTLESGERLDLVPTLSNDVPRIIAGQSITRVTFEIPATCPTGYHTIHASAAPEVGALIVAPQAVPVNASLTEQPAWGFSGLLYAMRSKLSWGLGDFADVAELGFACGEKYGADFLMLAPIHASETRPPFSASPFRASSRRWINPMYVRIEDIHETTYVRPENRSLIDWHSDDSRSLNKIAEEIDRNRAWGSKLSSLALVYDVPLSASREAEFERFISDGGEDLHNFAVYSVMRAEIGLGDTRWQTEARGPHSPLAEEVAEQRKRDVRFHMWMQWVADQQLANAHRVCRDAGMRIGLLREIVPGVTIYGSDAWGNQHVYSPGIRQGSQTSVVSDHDGAWVWDQPVYNPRDLREAAFEPFKQVIRSHLRHAGAVRINRILDLFRQWWVPNEFEPEAGTYVRYDHEALFNVIVLEATRAGALVIGDLDGGVEPWIRDYLTERGILNSAMLWRQKDEAGAPLSPKEYPKLTFATLTSPELPALAGYLGGELVDVRNRLGLIKGSFAQERLEDVRVRQPFLTMAREGGFISEDSTERQIIEGLHRFVAASDALLVSVAIGDAVGERRAPYVAGALDAYPSWKLPLADSTGDGVTVDSIPTHPRLESLAKSIAKVRGRFAPPR